MIKQEILDEMEIDALKRNIPVMQKEGIDFIVGKLKETHADSLLEIGSAIGYSAILMASAKDDVYVTTIERDEKRKYENDKCKYINNK